MGFEGFEVPSYCCSSAPGTPCEAGREAFSLTLATHSGQARQIHGCLPDEHVHHLRARASVELGIPCKEVSLYLGDRKLQQEGTLGELGLQDGTLLHCVRESAPKVPQLPLSTQVDSNQPTKISPRFGSPRESERPTSVSKQKCERPYTTKSSGASKRPNPLLHGSQRDPNGSPRRMSPRPLSPRRLSRMSPRNKPHTQNSRRLSGGSSAGENASANHPSSPQKCAKDSPRKGAKDSPRKGAKTARTHQRTPSFRSQSELGPFSARCAITSNTEQDESPACKLVSALCGKAEKLLQEVKVATEHKLTPPVTPTGSVIDESQKSVCRSPRSPSKEPVDELWELKMRLNKVELELDQQKRKSSEMDNQPSIPEDMHVLKVELQETRHNLSEAQGQLREAQDQIRALEKKFNTCADGSSIGGCLSPASSCGSFTPGSHGVRPGHGCSGGTYTPPQHSASSPCLAGRHPKVAPASTYQHFGSILEASPRVTATHLEMSPRVTATLVPVQRRTSARSSPGDAPAVKPIVSKQSLFRPILAGIRAREQRWQQLAQQHQQLRHANTR